MNEDHIYVTDAGSGNGQVTVHQGDNHVTTNANPQDIQNAVDALKDAQK